MTKIKHEDLINKTFGKVTVLEFSHVETRKIKPGKDGWKNTRNFYYYKYLCECANVGITNKETLLSAKNYSCKACRGISLGVRNKISSKKYDDPIDAKCSVVYSNYKSRSKLKGISFELSFFDFKKLVLENCYYCDAKPNMCRADRAKSRQGTSRIYFNGLDRIDNNQGYTKKNVSPCCEDCNKAKRDLSFEDFLNLIKNVYKKHFLDKNLG